MGPNGKTVPIAPTAAPGSEFWIQPRKDRPHWNEFLGFVRGRRDDDRKRQVFYITDDGPEVTVEENE